MLLRVPVAEYDTIEALIEAGMLTVAQALDRREVERAIGEVVAEFSRRWLASSCER